MGRPLDEKTSPPRTQARPDRPRPPGSREPEPEVTQYMANGQGCRNVGFKLEGFEVMIRPLDPKDNARAVKLARRLVGG